MIISSCQCPQPTRLISSFCLGRDLYCVVGCIGHLRWSAGISGGSVGISPPRHLIFGINEDWHCPVLARAQTGWMGLGGGAKEQQPVQSLLGVTLKTVCGTMVGTPVSDNQRILQGAPSPLCCCCCSVGDTVQAEPHCLLEVKHISDQTATPNTQSSSSWLAVQSLPVLPVTILILLQVSRESP